MDATPPPSAAGAEVQSPLATPDTRRRLMYQIARRRRPRQRLLTNKTRARGRPRSDVALASVLVTFSHPFYRILQLRLLTWTVRLGHSNNLRPPCSLRVSDVGEAIRRLRRETLHIYCNTEHESVWVRLTSRNSIRCVLICLLSGPGRRRHPNGRRFTRRFSASRR
jgi:hypothetical protein